MVSIYFSTLWLQQVSVGGGTPGAPLCKEGEQRLWFSVAATRRSTRQDLYQKLQQIPSSCPLLVRSEGQSQTEVSGS